MSKHLALKQTYNDLPRELSSDVEIVSLENPSRHGIYKGVWDTGATGTSIDTRVFHELNLTPIKCITIHGVNSTETVPLVLIDIILPNRIMAGGIYASVSHIPDADMLIGMDVILLGDLSISNFDGKTVFTFAHPPFPNRVDLYTAALAENSKIV
jgi:hypothetical protein